MRLTKTEKRIYDHVVSHYKANENSPTMKEIAENLGWKSVASASKYIGKLVAKGYLEKDYPGMAYRNYRPTNLND